MNYQPRAGTYPAGHGPSKTGPDESYLKRIAEALERIADAIAGPVTLLDADPLPDYPVLELDYTAASHTGATGPHIACSSGVLYFAVCTYCPAIRGKAADLADPSTWLENDDSSYDLDEQRVILTRHLDHHRQQTDPTAALPIWTWADQPCPRCHAPTERPCRTTSGRPSTTTHAARWRDHSNRYW
ncbi:zinc finger domain-containing protein [Actinoplanes awajinensis]|uniref:zinc finger domain-containing protein n=1 Tax=Actinoplanes awajinensis TaxID=135946 RepID=UPI0012F9200D|nr:hypothetical protein [Actinoplanes awajinensis]